MPFQYDKDYFPNENKYKEKEDRKNACGWEDKKDFCGYGDKKDSCGYGDKKDSCGYGDKKEDCGCESKGGPEHPEPKKILLVCGCKPQEASFDPCDCWDKKEPFFVLDTVNVDTTCLGKSLVKIEFSSLVFLKARTEQCPSKEIKVDLLFELVRSCKGEKEVLQCWRYLKKFETGCDDKLEVEFSEPFTVTFCDRACPECCEYKIIVKAKELRGEIEALKVVKPDLSALAQRICD